MQCISQLNFCAPLLPVNLTVNVRRFYNSVVANIDMYNGMQIFYNNRKVFTLNVKMHLSLTA